MNPSFPFRERQRGHRNHTERSSARVKASLINSGFMHSQRVLIFAYKGIVIKRENGMYVLDREFKIKGMNPADVSGIWNNGRDFKIFLDALLEKADPVRLAEVRACYRNWTCPRCNLTELFSEEQMHGPHIHCKYCGTYIEATPFPEASDEIMR